MSESAPRFQTLSFSEILDQTFRLYVQDFGKLVGLSYLVYLPVMGMQISALFMTEMGGALMSIASAPVAIFSGAIFTASAALIVSQRYLGEPIGLGAAVRRAMGMLGRVIWTQIVAMLWIVLGLLLLVVPGIYWSILYTFMMEAVVLEGLSGNAALKRSKELFRFSPGKTIGVLLGLGLLVMGVTMAFGMGIGAVAAMSGAKVLGNPWLEIAPNLLSYLLAPLSYVALILLYYDIRIRKEGFDLEMLSRDMARV